LRQAEENANYFAMTLKKIICHKCDHLWEFEPPLGRRDECPSCHADARVCFNCRFHDRSAYRECREEQAEWVKEKTSGNFCSYFDASAHSGDKSAGVNAVKSKLDQLFSSSGSNSEKTTSEPSENSSVRKPSSSLQDELAKFLNSKK